MTGAAWRAAWLVTLLLMGVAQADDYPNHPVRVIAPFPPGGGVDLVTRLAADILSRQLGQQFVVDNRPGAGANLGAELLAKAPPDGYTIGTMTIGTHGINPALYKHLPFDPVRDFTPITLLITQPNAMMVSPKLGVHSVAEFITLAKEKPGQLNFGSSGNGTSLHLSGELLKQLAGINIVHVPYKGAAQAIPDLIAGRVQVVFDNLVTVRGHIASGELMALAVTSRERWPLLPDIPTMQEAGLPGFVVDSWYSLMGPAGVPRERVLALYSALRAGMTTPEMTQRLLEMGARPALDGPEALAAHVDAEIKREAGRQGDRPHDRLTPRRMAEDTP
jgi:tripartite-type tricarboxylate transporter receptor subunit TctC